MFKRLVEHGLHLELDESTKEFLIDKGYNPEFGARPLRRAIEQYIEDPLSEELLRGKFKGKSIIRIAVKDEEHLKFEGVKGEQKIDAASVVVHSEGEPQAAQE